MTYTSLEIIPWKVFMRILDDKSNIHLLSDQELSLTVLEEIWDKLYNEHLDLDPTGDFAKTIKFLSQVDYFAGKKKIIELNIEFLRVSYIEEVAEIIRDYGYSISPETYLQDCESIIFDLQAIDTKIEVLKAEFELKNKRKDIDESSELKKPNYDEILACYAMFLGFDFDFNTVSYMKVIALKKQYDMKVKAYEKIKQPIKKTR